MLVKSPVSVDKVQFRAKHPKSEKVGCSASWREFFPDIFGELSFSTGTPAYNSCAIDCRY